MAKPADMLLLQVYCKKGGKMPVQEQISDKIFKYNEDLSKFIQEDEHIAKELNEYAKTLKSGLSRDSLSYFMFDKTLENGEKIIDIYIKKNKALSAEDKKILKEFKNSINSVFEIKKVLNDGFELYNLVNEKDYTVKSLVKMVNYRGVIQGNYFVCRLIPFEKEYYLLVLNSILRTADRQTAYKLAVSMQVETPELLYKDNNKKLKELEKTVKNLHTKFDKFFKKDEIISLNKNIDEILGAFNDFVEEGVACDNLEELVKSPEKYSYFKVSGSADPFDLTTRRADTEKYDVGIVFDADLGIQVLPFYGTFKHIFEVKDYKSVNGYKGCIVDYFNNPKVPPSAIKKVADKYGENFLKIVKEVLGIKEKIEVEELIHKYKQDFLSSKKFSSTTVLYASEAFSSLMESSVEAQQESLNSSLKIGRNDPCPCGSGKKFKKCCAV